MIYCQRGLTNQSTSYVSTLFRNFRWTTMKNWIYYSTKFVKVLTLFKWINNQFFVSVSPCILILIWRTFCFKVPYTWKFSDVKWGNIGSQSIVHIFFFYNFLIKFQTIYKISFPYNTSKIDYFDKIYSKEDWNIFLYPAIDIPPITFEMRIKYLLSSSVQQFLDLWHNINQILNDKN